MLSFNELYFNRVIIFFGKVRIGHKKWRPSGPPLETWGKEKSPEIYGIRVGTLKYIIGFAKYKANRISVLAGVNKMAFSSFRGTLKTKNQRSVHNRSLIFRAVYET